ncbi:3-hydroxyacyl-ACP dehydratase FabZ family protein [Jiangella endophytica]|uniref:3-hydroxyacyl-ACP dehydratase FabZ family protein n=1 Tax=Jiangella endophytica TaxID=1623398 RepID=UPI000E3459A8|nr:hydroxymyristoyl-ACP dehydratase [Jiangella endophytica]
MTSLMSLDRVVDVESGRRAEAIRAVPGTLDLFDSHFPRFPVLPGVLILGTLGTLAELLMRDTTRSSWRLGGASGVRYRHFVRPGDLLRLTVELITHDDGTATCSAVAAVEERRVTTVRRLLLDRVAGGAPCAG